jgi:phage terminase large subunit-like protein
MTSSTGCNSLDSAAQYQRDVLSGKIITGKLVKLAVERNARDLETAEARGLYFDEEEAERALKFFSYLRHSKGELAGKVIELQPWQCWIISVVFGWYNQDTGARRFNTVYEEIARKNGKTTKLGGIGLFGLVKDGEGGAEIYAAATKRDQARILFEESKRMISQCKALRSRLDNQQHKIYYPATSSKFEPLSADANSMDGLNPHFALVDELHAHKTAQVWDVLISALGARLQPIIWAITTAGFNKNGICYEVRDYTIKVLQGIIDDDSFFGIIYTIDEEDDWQDENVWIKANPNLNISVNLDYLRNQAKKAAIMPSAKVNFLTKHLNVWVTGASQWCNIERWMECAADYDQNNLDPEEIEAVYIGLDLAQISDIASATGVCVMKSGEWRIIGKHYLPEDSIEEKYRKTTIPFYDWAERGYLTLTPGNVIDYNWIKSDLLAWLEVLPVKEIPFDRYNSSQLVNDMLELGAPMVSVGQGFVSMSPALKELERRYLTGQIKHCNDPVLNWAMSNVVAVQDPAGNIKPDKSKSSEKIDPATALTMAVGRAMLADTAPDFDYFLSNPIAI